MARPHVEFVQAQNVAWQDAASLGFARRAEAKLLNRDPVDGACTLLLRYAPGECAPAGLRRAGGEELYVLQGSLELGDRALAAHHYAFLPGGAPRPALRSTTGAVVLTFCNGGQADLAAGGDDPRASPGSPRPRATPASPEPPSVVDAQAMPWDGTTLDPKLAHLRLSRKILRLAPDGSCRTYLLAGLPHGRPADGRLQLERHPHAEEMFLISGDMDSPQGTMRAGAYFYRPAGIVHGPHFSTHGFLMFMRNPGTNTIRTEWLGDARSLPPEPPYAPVLPDDAPAAWRRAHGAPEF